MKKTSRVSYLIAILGAGVLACLLGGYVSARTAAAQTVAARENSLPVIYFDLGNVLIDTRDAKGFHFTVGSQQYLKDLLANHYTLRLITNIPETFGANQDEKFAKLKSYVANLWVDTTPFPWEIFDRVLLPPSDALRKPNPYLFVEGMGIAGPCQPFYVGEDTSEVNAAEQAGYIGVLTEPGGPVGPPAFAPLSQLTCHPRGASRD